MSFLERNIHYIGLNFVSQERLDPLIQFFLNLLGLSENQFVYVIVELLICAAGVGLLLAISRSKGAWLAGVWTAIALLVILGLEPFYLKVHWFPWMLSAYILLLLRRSFATACLSAVFSILWIVSAGALAPFGVILASVASVVISLSKRSFTLVVAEGSRSYLVFSSVVLAALLAAVYLIPVYPMPNYPATARLTVEQLFPLMPFPLVGNRLHPIPVVQPVYFGLLALYGQNYLLLLMSVAVGIGVAGVLWLESIRRAVALLAFHAVGTTVVVFSLLYWPEHKIALHPFVLLMRVVPGMGFVFLPWMLLPFSVLFLSLGLFADCSRRTILMVVGATGLMGVALSLSGNYPPSQAHFAEFGVTSGASPYVGVTWSPSAAVVANTGPWIATPGVAEQRDFKNMKRLLPPQDYRIVETSSFPNEDHAGRAVDGNVFSAWNTGRPQTDGDFYSIRFAEPVGLARVVLSIEKTPQLYPCSIGVWGEDENGVVRELLLQDPWPGPVFWSDDGFPYFGEKQFVVLDFPNRQHTLSLRFEILSSNCQGESARETGRATRNWAIGEFKFYDIVR